MSLLVLIYVGLPFLAPVLMNAGLDTPARLIYRGYSLTCHQLAYRSFFVFGEQPAYPRESSGVDGVVTYGQASGLSEDSTDEALLAARWFLGSPAMGYKVALCERDVAIYGSQHRHIFTLQLAPPAPCLDDQVAQAKRRRFHGVGAHVWPRR